jgi:hypothetical protein
VLEYWGCASAQLVPVAEDHFLALYTNWLRSGGSDSVLAVAYSDRVWHKATLLGDPGRTATSEVPRAGSDTMGNTTVVWASATGIASRGYTPDGTWSPVAFLTNVTEEFTRHVLADMIVGSAGDDLLLWYSMDETRSPLFAKQRIGNAPGETWRPSRRHRACSGRRSMAAPASLIFGPPWRAPPPSCGPAAPR